MQLLKYYLISFFSMIHTLIKILRSKYVESAISFFREHNVGARKLREGWKDGFSRTWVTHFHVHRGNLWSPRFDNCTSIHKSEHMKPSLQNWGRVAASQLLLLYQRPRKPLAHPRQLCRKLCTLTCGSAGKLDPFGIRRYYMMSWRLWVLDVSTDGVGGNSGEYLSPFMPLS